MEYYKNQLSKLNKLELYDLTIKLNDSVNSTNFLSLNLDSIAALKDFLNDLETIIKQRGQNETK